MSTPKDKIVEVSNGSYNLKIGDVFRHLKSRQKYIVVLFANVEENQSNAEKYPPSVVYQNTVSKRFFVRKIADFGSKSFERIE